MPEGGGLLLEQIELSRPFDLCPPDMAADKGSAFASIVTLQRGKGAAPARWVGLWPSGASRSRQRCSSFRGFSVFPSKSRALSAQRLRGETEGGQRREERTFLSPGRFLRECPLHTERDAALTGGSQSQDLASHEQKPSVVHLLSSYRSTPSQHRPPPQLKVAPPDGELPLPSHSAPTSTHTRPPACAGWAWLAGPRSPSISHVLVAHPTRAAGSHEGHNSAAT